MTFDRCAASYLEIAFAKAEAPTSYKTRNAAHDVLPAAAYAESSPGGRCYNLSGHAAGVPKCAAAAEISVKLIPNPHCFIALT